MRLKEKANLGQSLEDYLEAVFILSRERKVVRVTDIAKRLNVKKPSVVVALKKLKDLGFIQQERYGYIELTDEGYRKAEAIYKKHLILLEFFKDVLGVSPDVAENDACLMEHYLSDESLSKMREFIKRLRKQCPGFVVD